MIDDQLVAESVLPITELTADEKLSIEKVCGDTWEALVTEQSDRFTATVVAHFVARNCPLSPLEVLKELHLEPENPVRDSDFVVMSQWLGFPLSALTISQQDIARKLFHLHLEREAEKMHLLRIIAAK